MPNLIPPIMLAATLLTMPAQAAPTLHFQSGTQQVHLLELFTSQGCSSCPPADHWLSTLTSDARLWKQLVPVAWHVNYWDYLGWHDRFAAPENSSRQRKYKKRGLVNSVYTPGFVVDGHEWKDWFSRQPLPLDKSRAGNLQVTVNGKQLEVNYPNDMTQRIVNVAVLGFGLNTPVASGENSDRTLHEDFVSLWHQQQNSADGKWRFILPDRTRYDAKRYGIAVWISNPGSPAPLQATGGWWQ